MKRTLITTGLAALLLAGSAVPAKAIYTVNAVRGATTIVFTGSGSLNLTAWTANGNVARVPGVHPANGIVAVGTLAAGNCTQYINAVNFAGPASFGTGGITVPGAGASANFVSINGTTGQLCVPTTYVSGVTLANSTATFSVPNPTTFTALGMTPGRYEWTWGSGATADSFVLNVVERAPFHAIYNCTATYDVDYSYTDSRVADVDFEGGRSQKFKRTAKFYMIFENNGSVDLVYYDPFTTPLRYSTIINVPYDCFQLIDVGKTVRPKLVVANCHTQAMLDINEDDGAPADPDFVDGTRCEVLCLSGDVPRGGNRFVIPGVGNLALPGEFFSYMPNNLNGTYCRKTCYNTARTIYREITLNAQNYSYTNNVSATAILEGTGTVPALPALPTVYGIASVTGKISCKLDRNLTLEFISTAGSGDNTVRNYLNSLGYAANPTTSTRTWAEVDQFPDRMLPQVPFLP